MPPRCVARWMPLCLARLAPCRHPLDSGIASACTFKGVPRRHSWPRAANPGRGGRHVTEGKGSITLAIVVLRPAQLGAPTDLHPQFSQPCLLSRARCFSRRPGQPSHAWPAHLAPSVRQESVLHARWCLGAASRPPVSSPWRRRSLLQQHSKWQSKLWRPSCQDR